MSKILNIIFVVFLASISTVSFAAQCAPKKHAKVPNITNKTYHQARKLLISNNWQPLRTLSANSTESDLGYGNAWGFWKKGYKEVESCAGTGLAPCVFNFKDVYGNKLKVYTEGEEMDGSYAGVSSYSFSCEK